MGDFYPISPTSFTGPEYNGLQEHGENHSKLTVSKFCRKQHEGHPETATVAVTDSWAVLRFWGLLSLLLVPRAFSQHTSFPSSN